MAHKHKITDRLFPGRIPRDLELPDHLDDTVPGLGGRGRLARQHGPGGALGIDGVGLADGAARVPVPPIHFDDTMPRAADGPRQAGTIAAGTFDAERLNPPVCVGPHEQGLISARISDERVIAQADPPGVDRHRDVDMLVGIDPDNHLPNLGLRGHGVSHRLASSGAARGLARVGGQDCDGPWVRQAPMGSRPIRSAGCRTIGRWAVTDRSMTRTVGQSSRGSGHRPPAPTGVTERPRQAGGSCSQSS